MKIEEAKTALKNKVLVLMFLRAVFAIVFLGITTWFQVRQYSFSSLNPYPLYAIVVIIGLLTLIYAITLRWVKNLRLFIYLQVSADIAVITMTVYVTGGIESYLHVLYLLSIIGAAILLSKRGGYYTASLAAISYGVLIDLDFYALLPVKYKIFPSYFNHQWDDALTSICTNIVAYFSVALLTGYLAGKTEGVEKRLAKQTIDFDRLSRVNESILANITSGIMTLDDELRITSFNRAAEIISGYSLKDVYYHDIKEIFPGIFTSENAISADKSRLEKVVQRKDGTDVFIGFRYSWGKGADDAYIIIFQDLTKLRRMEEELRRAEKLKALGELSVGIAHEVRNPLASMSGSIQMLSEQLSLTGDDRTLMNIVLREGKRLNELITDFLLFARPARKERKLVNLAHILNDNIQLLRNSCETGDIAIACDIDETIDVEGDARQLGQVFWNIFLNSVNAMGTEGGEISITSSISDTQPFSDAGSIHNRSVSIKVKDSGKGMDETEISKIFDPFYTTRAEGTGLGLAIAYSIIKDHGGGIQVSSVPDTGTEFTITLPILTESEGKALS